MLRSKKTWSLRRTLSMLTVAGALMAMTAAPAFAFVHENVPADECSGNDMAGNNPTAGSNVFTKNKAQGGENLPLADNSKSPVPAACR